MIFIVSIANKIFVIKNPAFMFDSLNGTVSDYYMNRWDGFYALEENTLDVLFFGGSQEHCDISPMAMYREYGFKSYDVSADQQNIALRYYCIVEALKYQTPQVIVVDLNGIASPEIASGDAAHYTYDFMRPSVNKLKGILSTVEKQDWFELIVPISAYHTRWKEIEEKDFAYLGDQQPSPVGGFFGYYRASATEIEPDGTEELDGKEISKVNREYLDKIVDLCNSKRITLIFTLLPRSAHQKTIFTYNNALQSYADEKNILYIDYTYPKEVGLNYQEDFADSAHLNILGAEKISKHLGRYIEEYLNDSSVNNMETDYVWQENLVLYEEKITEQKLRMIGNISEDDFYDYLHMIEENPNWITIVAGRGANLLLDFDRYKSDEEFNWNYFAVIDGGEVIEEVTSSQAVNREVELQNSKVT